LASLFRAITARLITISRKRRRLGTATNATSRFANGAAHIAARRIARASEEELMDRPAWDNQFAEDEDERNARLRQARHERQRRQANERLVDQVAQAAEGPLMDWLGYRCMREDDEIVVGFRRVMRESARNAIAAMGGPTE
jgi:hypothetical protein